MNDNRPPFNIPFRITIGVTGHRKLDNESLVRATVRRILDDVIKGFKNNNGIPVRFCALSPLAEGADRLVAGEILKHEGATLKVLLPMTEDDYIKDFHSAKSIKEFKTLLARDPSPVSLRNNSLSSEFPAGMAVQARRLAYEEAGKFVSDHCDVLIAIWDGKPGKSSAGTAGIIDYARKNRCPLYIINTSAPGNFTFEQGDGIADAMMRKVKRFNRQLEKGKNSGVYRQAVYNLLFDNPQRPEGRLVPANVKSIVGDLFIPCYVTSSKLAKRYQDIYRRVGIVTFGLSFAAVGVAAAATVFDLTCFGIMAAKFLIIAMILCAISFADRIRSHRNWMEYRFLTERIRSGFFLFTGSALEKTVHFPRRGHDTDDHFWVLLVIEEIWNYARSECKPLNDKDLAHAAGFISAAWIDDQLEYHRNNHEKNSRLSRRCEKYGRAIFIIAIIAIISEIILQLSGIILDFHMPAIVHRPFEETVTLLLIILPALGSTVEAVRSHRQYSRLAQHSRNMEYRLEKISSRFNLLTPGRLQLMLHEIDSLLMSETGDWLNMMRFSKLHRSI